MLNTPMKVGSKPRSIFSNFRKIGPNIYLKIKPTLQFFKEILWTLLNPLLAIENVGYLGEPQVPKYHTMGIWASPKNLIKEFRKITKKKCRILSVSNIQIKFDTFGIDWAKLCVSFKPGNTFDRPVWIRLNQSNSIIAIARLADSSFKILFHFELSEFRIFDSNFAGKKSVIHSKETKITVMFNFSVSAFML